MNTNSLNILFIAPSYLPNIGGVERHIQCLSNEIIKDGHKVEILVNSPRESNLKDDLDINPVIKRIKKNHSRFLNRINIVTYVYKNFFRLLKFDIIHVHDFHTFEAYILPIYPLLYLSKRKIYVTFHGWEGDFPPKKNIIFRRKIVEGLSYKNICIGHFISKWYKTRANIVSYGGVEPVLSRKYSENYLLFVGRLEKDTGIWNYLKSWASLSKKYSKDRFLICGDGSLKNEIQQYVNKNNIPNVVFLGFIDNVIDYMVNAKIVYTSGYLGILEAFSCQKKVIATYDNELKEDYLKMIPNYEKMFWVAEGVSDIVEATELAISDNEKPKLAYQFSLDNNWANVCKGYYKIWNI